MSVRIAPGSAPISSAGGTVGSIQVTPTPSNPVSATAAANTAVTITIPLVAGLAIRLTSLSWSYSAAPTAGVLTVVVNAVTILQLDIAAAGPGIVELPAGGLECQLAQACVITLTAAGAAVTGRLNASSYNGT